MYKFVATYLFIAFTSLLTSASPVPPLSAPTIPHLEKRLKDLRILCRNGIFQNPDEDIAEDICVARNRCMGGDIAEEEVTDEGELVWTTTCVGCPSRVGNVMTGCEIVGATAVNITTIAG